MTEQHSAVAFLLAAHQQAEGLARAATPGPWEPEGDDETDDEVFTAHDGEHGDLVGGTVAFVRSGTLGPDGGRTQANMRLIASFADPVAVLRRVAAERELLAEHQPTREAKWRGPGSWDPCDLPGCPCAGVTEDSAEADLIAGCGMCASGHSYDAVVEHWPCRTVLLLAKSWGWEEAS